MANYHVTHVRKQQSGGLITTHEHIVGVWTTANVMYTNAEVVSSIAAGNVWVTSVLGAPEAQIHTANGCGACGYAPYLRTDGDRWAANNLENLPKR